MTDHHPDRSQAMTTTREAALEAALKLARNRLQACAIDYPTGSREMAERSEWADEATAALSTPATEPQGLVENDTIDSFCLTLRRLVSDAYAERDRFGHIAATIHVNALHHGATNAEVEAMLSGEISFVNWIADKVEARPAPQPAADTRVVTVLELNHLANTAAECGLSVMAETIRAIIGTATPAQSDKIAEAARVLLDATPNPVFDMLKPVLIGEFSQPMESTDEDGNEVTHKMAISWTVTKEIIAAALCALAGMGSDGLYERRNSL